MKRSTNSIIGLMVLFVILLQSDCAECDEGRLAPTIDPAVSVGLVAAVVSSFVCSAMNMIYMSHGTPKMSTGSVGVLCGAALLGFTAMASHTGGNDAGMWCLSGTLAATSIGTGIWSIWSAYRGSAIDESRKVGLMPAFMSADLGKVRAGLVVVLRF